MSNHIKHISDNTRIPYEDIRLYIFADARMEGWGSEFIRRAENRDSKERHYLLNGIVSYEAEELVKADKLTLVLPREWFLVFQLINQDPNTLRPGLNGIAVDYLLYKEIVKEPLPKDKEQTSWGLNHADNFIHVEYYVDTANRVIIPKNGFQMKG